MNSDFAQEILEAYHQQNVAEYLLLKYNYANLPAFEYDADFTPDESILAAYDDYKPSKERQAGDQDRRGRRQQRSVQGRAEESG